MNDFLEREFRPAAARPVADRTGLGARPAASPWRRRASSSRSSTKSISTTPASATSPRPTSPRTKAGACASSRSTRPSATSSRSILSTTSRPISATIREVGRDGHPRRRRREVRRLARNAQVGLRGRLAREVPDLHRGQEDPDDVLLRVPGQPSAGRPGLSSAGLLRRDDGVGPRARRAGGLSKAQGRAPARKPAASSAAASSAISAASTRRPTTSTSG